MFLRLSIPGEASSFMFCGCRSSQGSQGSQDKWDFYFSKSALYLLAGRQRIVIRQAAGQEGALTDLLK